MCASLRARGIRARDVGTKSVERVVGDQAPPHQAPQRVDCFSRISAAYRLVHRIEEAGAGGFENRKDFLFAFGERFGKWALLSEQWQLVGEKKSDASVSLAYWIDSGPRNFTRGN